MLWYVRMDGRLVGWVIAATEAEALQHAHAKFPARDFPVAEVQPRRRKRGRG